MELKLARGRLRIHLLFLPTCGILLYLNGVRQFCAFGAALLLHEAFHLFMASALGVQVISLELLPFGCAANLGGMEYTARGKEILIAAAGPAASLIAAAACKALEPVDSCGLFLRSNLALGAMNLMPALPLDGGRIGTALLELFLPKSTARGISAGMGILLGIAIGACGVVISGGKNISFWVMGGFMIISACQRFHAEDPEEMTAEILKQRCFSKNVVMEVKNFACRGTRTLGEVYVALDQRKYNVIYVVDREMRVKGILDEGTLRNRLLREGSGSRILQQKESEQKLLRLPK